MKTLLPALALLLLAACEFTRDAPHYDPLYAGDRVVAHGYLSQAEGVVLYVQKSVHPLQTLEADASLPGAVVELFADGRRLATLRSDGAGFHHGPPSLLGDTAASYSLQIHAPGLPSASCGPIRLPARGATFHQATLEGDSSEARARVSFYDLPQGGSRYSLRFSTFVDGLPTEAEAGQREGYLGLSTIKDELNSPLIVRDYAYGLETPDGRQRLDSLRVKLFTLSAELALYMESLSLNEGDAGDPFATPTAVLSNLRGGYGFVGSYALDSIPLVPDWE